MSKYAYSVLPLLLVLAIIPTTLAVSTSCETRLFCEARVDKPYYSPGDSGKLTIDIKNLFSYPIQVNNLTISFPWTAYINGQWDGNSTVTLTAANTSSNQWVPEQTVSFNVPSDGRFPSSFLGGSSVTIGIHFIAYCPSCNPGEYRTDGIFGVSIVPNALLISTGWQSISSYLLYTDILLGALTVLFLVHIFVSRRKNVAVPR